MIDQILRLDNPDKEPMAERHRLWSYYRADGVVTDLVRAPTTDENVRPSLGSLPTPHVHRVFHYDTQGRRIGSDDPDTDDPALVNTDPSRATWRYLFNRAGDLAAVRDPRGCGQNFFYDLGGRLLGEQYVGCAEAYSAADVVPVETISLGSVGMDVITAGNPLPVDVRYFYDDDPTWVTVEDHGGGLAGRATGVSDRGQRSGVGYDARGNAVWTARQMAVISDVPPMTGSNGARPSWDETTPSARNVDYDEDHTYVRTARFDHAGRGVALVLPEDFTWGATGGTGTAPTIGGELVFGNRGLPISARATIGCDPVELEDCDAGDRHPIVANIEYTRDGLPLHTEWGDANGTHPSSDSSTTYDVRRRPTDMITTRAPTGMSGLAAVSEVVNQHLVWDEASNLIAIEDGRPGAEWDPGHRPQTVHVSHDALYRVTGAEFSYTQDDDTTSPSDTATDWRDTQAAIVSAHVDPMEVEPAGMIPSLPAERVQALDWSWDWLGNTTSWTEGATDPTNFYERAIGEIHNGNTQTGSALRPSALYLATDIPTGTGVASLPSGSSPGWVEVDYGAGGNVTAMTVHGRCVNASNALVCADLGPGSSPAARAAQLRASCACANEQHYDYRWDELDRLSEARRWDRNSATMGSWDLAVRQRYLYDGANVRTIKQTTEPSSETAGVSAGAGDERIALYVYAGDHEVRGLERGLVGYTARTGTNEHVETQFVVGGARLVWRHADSGLASDRRFVLSLRNGVMTAMSAVDLLTGGVVEASTYYPNGAREALVAGTDPSSLESDGFTGKEADEEVGATYFGERYLIARIGRWATPDPLHVHSAGGGDALNAYHYVAGNTLQSRDPTGLWGDVGHYYVTLLAALHTGHSAEQAQRIAFATELPDEVGSLDAVELALSHVEAVAGRGLTRATDYVHRIHRGLHGLTGGSSVAVRDVGADQAVQARDDFRLGAALHLLGDGYAHTSPMDARSGDRQQHEYPRMSIPLAQQRQVPPVTGHMFLDNLGATMHIDNIANDPEAFMAYARQLWSVLNERQGGNASDDARDAFLQDVIDLMGTTDQAEQRRIAQRLIVSRFGEEALGEYRPEEHDLGTVQQACEVGDCQGRSPAEVLGTVRDQAAVQEREIDRHDAD